MFEFSHNQLQFWSTDIDFSFFTQDVSGQWGDRSPGLKSLDIDNIHQDWTGLLLCYTPRQLRQKGWQKCIIMVCCLLTNTRHCSPPPTQPVMSVVDCTLCQPLNDCNSSHCWLRF